MIRTHTCLNNSKSYAASIVILADSAAIIVMEQSVHQTVPDLWLCTKKAFMNNSTVIVVHFETCSASVVCFSLFGDNVMVILESMASRPVHVQR